MALKSSLADAAWIERPSLRVTDLTLRAYGYATCDLAEPYGETGLREPVAEGSAADALAATPLADLTGVYVRVTVPMGYGSIDPDAAIGGANPEARVVWYGYVTAQARDRVAESVAQTGSLTGDERGEARLRAVGLEWFLGRVQIDNAVVKAAGGDTATRRIERPIAFNEEDPLSADRTQGARGNKAAFLPVFRAAEALMDAPRVVGVASADTAGVDPSIPLETLTASDVALPPDWTEPAPAVPASVVNQVNGVTGSVANPAYTLLAGTPVPLVWDDATAEWWLDADAAVEWAADDMVECLLTHHCPRDDTGAAAPCPFRLASGRLAMGPLRPEVRLDRRTPLEVLNEVCGRRRGLLWYAETVTPDEDPSLSGPEVRVHVTSLAPTAVDLGGGRTFPANPDAAIVDPDGDHFAGSVTVLEDLSQRYDSVRVRGGRMTVTATLGVADGTLVPDWLEIDEQRHKDGLLGDPDYPAGVEEQKLVNDAVRSELGGDHVFARFRPPADWDGRTGDGDDRGRLAHAFPNLSPTGSVLANDPVYAPAMRVRHKTRLPVKAASAAAAGFEPAFAVLPVLADDGPGALGGGVEAWALAHRFGEGARKNARPASYRVKRRERGVGVRLGSTKGLSHTMAGVDWVARSTFRANHRYAAGEEILHNPSDPAVYRWYTAKAGFTSGATYLASDWDPGASWIVPEPSRATAETDWRRLRVTVALEADRHAEAVELGSIASGEPRQTLVIEAGEKYRLDYLAANTVTGVDNGALVLEPTARVLRDDRAALAEIAALAYAWYRTPRKSVRLRLTRPFHRLPLGTLITRIGQTGTDEVNTVVSEVRFALGRPNQPTEIVTVGADAAPIQAAIGGRVSGEQAAQQLAGPAAPAIDPLAYGWDEYADRRTTYADMQRGASG
ncbi:MAG: hypothetical protein AAF805_00070 [Planctomycetota bacterium]